MTDCPLLSVSLYGGRGKGLCSLFCEGANPIHVGSAVRTESPPKTPPLNTRASYHTGHAFSTQEFRGTWSFRPVPVCIRSHVRLFMTSWTVACQSPKSMEFSIQTRPTLHVKRVSYMLYELHLSKKSNFWEAKLRQALLPPERVCLAVRKPWVLEPAALRSESRDYNPIWVLLSSWLGWSGTLRNIGGVIWV